MHSPAPPTRRILGVSALAAVAAIATACSSSGNGSSPATVTVTPSAPAGSPSPTGAPAPSTAAPSSPAGAAPAPCATTGLRVSTGASNGAAGTIYTNIDFTNTSGSACVLEGYPGVSLVSAGSSAGSQIGADAKRTTTTPVRPVTLGSGQTAHAVLGVAEAANFPVSKCNPVRAHWMKVFPPDQRAAAYVRFTTSTCASAKQPTMTISAISNGS